LVEFHVTISWGGVADEKRKKEERIAVNAKSTNDYVERPNKQQSLDNHAWYLWSLTVYASCRPS